MVLNGYFDQFKTSIFKYVSSIKQKNSPVGGYDGITIISVIVHMLTNYLGMPLIYLTAACFFAESEGVYVNAKLRIL